MDKELLKIYKKKLIILLEEARAWNQTLNSLAQENPTFPNDQLYTLDNEVKQDFFNFRKTVDDHYCELSNHVSALENLIRSLESHNSIDQNFLKYLHQPFREELYNSFSTLNEKYKIKFIEFNIFSSPSYRTKFQFPFVRWADPFLTTDNFILKALPNNNNACKITLFPSGENTTFIILQLALKAAYSRLENVEYLDLSECNLRDVDLSLISEGIRGENKYKDFPIYKSTIIILSENNITQEGVRNLLEATATRKKSNLECKIKQIILNQNRIDFNETFFRNTIQKKCDEAKLENLDLTLNFIPKGFMFEEFLNGKNRRIYYDKIEATDKLHKKKMSSAKRTEIKRDIFFKYNQLKIVRSLHPFLPVKSLIAGIQNDEQIFSYTHGFVGLFANKNSSLFKEHAYLMLEGISKFGQRYLLRGDLYYCPDLPKNSSKVCIKITQCTPQDFYNFTKNGELAFFKTARIDRDKVKNILKNICNSRNQQAFINYETVPPLNHKNTHNCLSWAVKQMQPHIEFDISSFIPSHNFKNCKIL